MEDIMYICMCIYIYTQIKLKVQVKYVEFEMQKQFKVPWFWEGYTTARGTEQEFCCLVTDKSNE